MASKVYRKTAGGVKVSVHTVTWEKGKSGAPNEETIRLLELFLHSSRQTHADTGQVFITPNSRSDEYLVPLTCHFPTASVNGYG
jgi:hypothetical protein